MTSLSEIEGLLEHYRNWLRDKTSLRQLNDWVEITTPYLDRHNDYIQIYVKENQEQRIILTDDGHTLQDLEMSGCRLDSPKRKQLLETTLRGFGVEFQNGVLQVVASRENFSLRKHNLLQAILAVNDLFYLAVPTISSLFLEDVQAWMELCNIRYTPRVKFTGRGGYDHLFDFIIPKSRQRPERILQAVSNPNKTAAQALAFACIDTKSVRQEGSKFYAILNDTERVIASGVSDALTSYDIEPIRWSERENIRLDLAA